MQDVKKVFVQNENRQLRVLFESGDVYVLYPHIELSAEKPEGIWACEFTTTIHSKDKEFRNVFVEGGYIDILESTVREIWDHLEDKLLYVRGT